MFDNADTGPLELLRVRPDFSLIPEFEARLRARFERLLSFSHRGFAQARTVNHLDNGEGLTVVSTHVPGTRLSELFETSRPHAGMHPVWARWALGELTSALSALHGRDDDIAHGALAPDRIVITAERHLAITDYVFGDALAHLNLPAERLWTEFGLVNAPSRDGVALDQRADVVQLGLIVMSLVLGRRVSPGQYPLQFGTLLEEFAAVSDRRAPDATSALRAWLEQALGGDGFRSAVEADLALVSLAGLPRRVNGRVQNSAIAGSSHTSLVPQGVSIQDERLADTDSVDLDEERPRPRSTGERRSRVFHFVAAALAVLALAQGAVIARLIPRPSLAPTVTTQPRVESGASGNAVLNDGHQVGVTPVPAPAAPVNGPTQGATAPPDLQAGAVLATSQTRRPGDDTAPASTADTGRARSGGIEVISPITVQVVDGVQILGSSANGPVFTTPGAHDLEFINNPLGFRTRQRIQVVAGRVVPLKLEPPNGSLSINARPWAQVWVDGKSMGDTPMANLPVPIGNHELLFRHPQLGERRRQVTVQANALTRFSETFEP